MTPGARTYALCGEQRTRVAQVELWSLLPEEGVPQSEGKPDAVGGLTH